MLVGNHQTFTKLSFAPAAVGTLALCLLSQFSQNAAAQNMIANDFPQLNIRQQNSNSPRSTPKKFENRKRRGAFKNFENALTFEKTIISRNLSSKKMPYGIPYPSHIQNAATFLTADEIEGNTDEVMHARGNVELRKPDAWLYGDALDYYLIDEHLDAQGNVKLMRYGVEVHAPKMSLGFADETGNIQNAQYFLAREVATRFYRNDNIVMSTLDSLSSTDENYMTSSSAAMLVNVAHSYGLPTRQPTPTRISKARGVAEEINILSNDHYQLKNARYSTCTADDPDWYVAMSDLDLDFGNETGSAKHTSLWFRGVPFLYAPYFSFPLSDKRKSGFLTPTYRTSTRTGLDIVVPYYLNIAPNYDATLYPRWMFKRGMQIGAEGRYLFDKASGYLRGEYLNDREFGDKRYAWQITHTQQFLPNLTGYVQWNNVSDDLYWQDLSSQLLQTSQVHLLRQVHFAYTPFSWLTTSMQTVRYQTLQTDPENPVTEPYFLEPQFNISVFKPNVANALDFSATGQFTRFKHQTRTNADRWFLYPQASIPVIYPAFQLTSKVGLHMTHYRMRQNSPIVRQGKNAHYSRALPTFTVDGNVAFERPVELRAQSFVQTLEPHLYYVYIPYRRQNHLPVFDTALKDFTFAQMFTENVYSGIDRINDANQLTLALATRFLGKNNGVEYFKAQVGERLYFRPQRVQLTASDSNDTRRNFSNLVGSVTGLVWEKTYAEMELEYNHRDSKTERFSIGARHQPDFGKVMSASYRYVKNPLTNQRTVDQFDLSAQWPLKAISDSFKNWYGVGRYNYSLRDGRLLEGILGVEYNADCWALRFVAQRVGALSGAANTSFFVQFELNDFTSVGTSPMELLRRSVPGYGKTNEWSP